MTELATHTDTPAPPADAHERIVQRNLKRNFIAHVSDGGLYTGGAMFTGALVLPKIIEALGAPGWLIAALPLAMTAGFTVPGLLTAHLIERLHRLKPLLLVMGIFQRLPYLLVAAMLFFGAERFPAAALAAVVLGPFLSGLCGGVGITAWQELVANTIPPQRRSSLWATRNIVAALIGLAAGGGVAAVLHRWPGIPGYSLLHLIAFAILMLSWGAFWFIRETPNPRPPATHTMGLAESLRRMPALVAGDGRFRRYLAANVFLGGLNIAVPFLSLHALAVLGEPESYLGIFVSVQMVGGFVGNVFAGFLGDRRGGKAVMQVGIAGLIAMCLWSMLASTAAEFGCIFFLFGAANYCLMVGRGTLNLEVCPLAERVRYLAIIGTSSLAGMAAAWAVSATATTLSGGRFAAVATLAAAALTIAGLFLLGVEEPRPRRPLVPRPRRELP